VALKSLYPAPKPRALRKVVYQLDDHCRRFIALSPFFVLSTVTPEGDPDLSPRGGDPGFVEIVDSQTLLLPDRPGNNRLDNLSNLATHAAVALLFMIPGVDETLRVYGTVEILPGSDFGARFVVNDRPPITVLKITVTRALFHCAKALMRARLWHEEAKIDRRTLPTYGEILKDETQDAAPPETQEEMLLRYAKEM
jgi:PPOX class probable FMN-dependent enzyme